jgi:hypothetical protein
MMEVMSIFSYLETTDLHPISFQLNLNPIEFRVKLNLFECPLETSIQYELNLDLNLIQQKIEFNSSFQSYSIFSFKWNSIST